MVIPFLSILCSRNAANGYNSRLSQAKAKNGIAKSGLQNKKRIADYWPGVDGPECT